MDKKAIELTPKEAMLLSIAVRGLGGSYVKGLKEKGITKEKKTKYDQYVDECLALAIKIETVFSVVSREIVSDDGKNKN